jgi:hypothetical protein
LSRPPVYGPMSSEQKPGVGSHRPRKPATLVRLGLPVLQRGGRWLLRVGKAVIEPYVGRKRRGSVAGERLAEGMVRYAKLCMSAGRTAHDLDEATTFLDDAASLYTEAGRSEDAAEALALRPRAGGEREAADG